MGKNTSDLVILILGTLISYHYFMKPTQDSVFWYSSCCISNNTHIFSFFTVFVRKNFPPFHQLFAVKFMKMAGHLVRKFLAQFITVTFYECPTMHLDQRSIWVLWQLKYPYIDLQSRCNMGYTQMVNRWQDFPSLAQKAKLLFCCQIQMCLEFIFWRQECVQVILSTYTKCIMGMHYFHFHGTK